MNFWFMNQKYTTGKVAWIRSTSTVRFYNCSYVYHTLYHTVLKCNRCRHSSGLLLTLLAMYFWFMNQKYINSKVYNCSYVYHTVHHTVLKCNWCKTGNNIFTNWHHSKINMQLRQHTTGWNDPFIFTVLPCQFPLPCRRNACSLFSIY